MITWDELRSKIKSCDRCVMSKTRKNVVIGRGSSSPIVVFVGEAPGETEDKTGMPFCGRAGDVLNSEIKRIGLSYNDYYITNACRCRPIDEALNNRKPTRDEIKNCSNFFSLQIQLLKPRIVVLLGESAETAFYISDVSSNFSGDVRKFLHPAAVLYRPKWYQVMKVQFDGLREIVEVIRVERAEKDMFESCCR